MIAYLPGFDLTGPANQKRNAQPSLVEIAFPSAELDFCPGIDVGTEKTARAVLRTEAVLTAIVPGKKENGVFLELEFFQKSRTCPS